MLDLTNYPLFDDLTSLQLNGKNIDFHNENIVTQIGYDGGKKLLNITLVSIHGAVKENAKYGISFEGAVIMKLNFIPDLTGGDNSIDNFYRGRFEQEGKLKDFSDDGSAYFYVELENGDKLEILAKRVVVFEL